MELFRLLKIAFHLSVLKDEFLIQSAVVRGLRSNSWKPQYICFRMTFLW